MEMIELTSSDPKNPYQPEWGWAITQKYNGTLHDLELDKPCKEFIDAHDEVWAYKPAGPYEKWQLTSAKPGDEMLASKRARSLYWASRNPPARVARIK